MDHFTWISDKPAAEWEAFLIQVMSELGEHSIDGIAIVALLDGDDGAITSYYNLDTWGRAEAAAHINADMICGILGERDE